MQAVNLSLVALDQLVREIHVSEFLFVMSGSAAYESAERGVAPNRGLA
jgi:hypothetical protein